MLKALWNQSWQSILKTGGKERRATGNHSEGLLCPAGDRGEATGDQSAFPLVRSRACSSSGPGAPSGQSSPSVNWLQLQRPERTCAALTSRALGWARLASTHLGVPFKGAGSFVRLWEGRPDSHLGWWPGLLLKRQWECRQPRAGQVGGEGRVLAPDRRGAWGKAQPPSEEEAVSASAQARGEVGFYILNAKTSLHKPLLALSCP